MASSRNVEAEANHNSQQRVRKTPNGWVSGRVYPHNHDYYVGVMMSASWFASCGGLYWTLLYMATATCVYRSSSQCVLIVPAAVMAI